jgi:hypothetical protein
MADRQGRPCHRHRQQQCQAGHRPPVRRGAYVADARPRAARQGPRADRRRGRARGL